MVTLATLRGRSDEVLQIIARFGARVDIATEKSLHWYVKDRILQEAAPL